MNYCLLTDVYGNDFNNVNYTNNNTNYTLLNKKYTEPLNKEDNIDKSDIQENINNHNNIQKQQENQNNNLLKQLYIKNMDEINNKIQELTKKINLNKQTIIQNKQIKNKQIKNKQIQNKQIQNKQNIIAKKSSRIPKKISTIINQKRSVIQNIIYGLLLLLTFDLYLLFIYK